MPLANTGRSTRTVGESGAALPLDDESLRADPLRSVAWIGARTHLPVAIPASLKNLSAPG